MRVRGHRHILLGATDTSERLLPAHQVEVDRAVAPVDGAAVVALPDVPLARWRHRAHPTHPQGPVELRNHRVESPAVGWVVDADMPSARLLDHADATLPTLLPDTPAPRTTEP